MGERKPEKKCQEIVNVRMPNKRKKTFHSTLKNWNCKKMMKKTNQR